MMQQDLSRASSSVCEEGVPLPIVTLNRSVLLAGVAIGLLAQQPLLTTLLFGQRGSPIAAVGRRLFARQILTAEREDRRLMRFNNTIALVLLGAAQIAFLVGLSTLGWAFALMVGIAAGVALAGFCFGCCLYYQFKLHRYRIFG